MLQPTPSRPPREAGAGRKASRKRSQKAETRWVQPGRAKTCKIMQIAFVRTPSASTDTGLLRPPVPAAPAAAFFRLAPARHSFSPFFLSHVCLRPAARRLPPSLAEHRASASVKNVSTIACRGVYSFIFAEGWNTRLGGAAAPGTQRGMKLRPPYLRLCRVGNEKRPGIVVEAHNPFSGSWVTMSAGCGWRR